MGWWSSYSDIVGDSPADLIDTMFEAINERVEGEGNPLPTLPEFLRIIKLVLNQNAKELLVDGETIAIKQIVAQLREKIEVNSENTANSISQELAQIVHNSFRSIKDEYEETLERKPRLREVLYSIYFILSTPGKYLSIEPGTSIKDIIAELEQGTIISVLCQPEVTPTTEAATEATVATNPEPEITFSWTEIGENNIISHQAINLLKQPFMALAHTYEQERGERPTVKELVDGLTTIFVQNLEEFCADGGEVIVEYLTINLDGEPYVESGCYFNVENANAKFVLQLKDVLVELIKLYQEKWQRLPKFQELLETIKLFLLQESLHEYLSIKKGTVVEEVLLISRRRLPYPWQDISNNDAISFDATHALQEAVESIAQTYSEEQGELPSQQKLFDSITTVIRSHLGEICSNSQEVFVEKLILFKEDTPDIVSNGGGLSPDNPLVIACRDAFATLSPIYESQWKRKPRLRELLKTLEIIINRILRSFVCDADRNIYLAKIVIE